VPFGIKSSRTKPIVARTFETTIQR